MLLATVSQAPYCLGGVRQAMGERRANLLSALNMARYHHSPQKQSYELGVEFGLGVGSGLALSLGAGEAVGAGDGTGVGEVVGIVSAG
jgi:hypothetical protein